MLMNRSALALAKFEEEIEYASNWGLLHLEWGQTLGYFGRKGDARAQYPSHGRWTSARPTKLN